MIATPAALARCRCVELPGARGHSAPAGLVASTSVRSHGRWPTCSSVALATVAEAHLLAATGAASELSVAHNYWWARALFDRPGQWGSRFEWALIAAAVKGWVTERACPMSDAALDEPPEIVEDMEVEEPRLVGRRLRRSGRVAADATMLLRALECGCPVVLDVPICEALLRTSPDGVLAATPGAPLGRHVVVAYAADVVDRGARVWVRGSWGTAWGRQGAALMPLDGPWLASVREAWLVQGRPEGCRCPPVIGGLWEVEAAGRLVEAS